MWDISFQKTGKLEFLALKKEKESFTKQVSEGFLPIMSMVSDLFKTSIMHALYSEFLGLENTIDIDND